MTHTGSTVQTGIQAEGLQQVGLSPGSKQGLRSPRGCPTSLLSSTGEWQCREGSRLELKDFPGGSVIKNPPANAGDMWSIPGLVRFHVSWNN